MSWSIDDIEFDANGRVIVNNVELAQKLIEAIQKRGGLSLRFSTPVKPGMTATIAPILRDCPPPPLKICPNSGCLTEFNLVAPLDTLNALTPSGESIPAQNQTL